MENKSHAFAAGLFVILVTGLLVGLAHWLSRDAKIRDGLEFSTRESVTGLSEQAPVRYRGITVGKVDKIEFDPKQRGNVLVRLAIDQGTPITQATYATLGYQGVTGLAYVQLDEPSGSANAQALAMGANPAPRIELKPSLLTKLSDQGANILIQVEETTKRMNQLLAPENQKTLVQAVAAVGTSATKLSQDVGASTQKMQAILDAQFGPERTDIPALVRDTRATMQSLQGTAGELAKTAQEATKAAAQLTTVGSRVTEKGGILDKVSDGITSASASVQSIGQSAQSMTQSLGQGVQTLSNSTLPRAGRMLDDTARAARSTDRVVNSLSDNPQSLIFGNAPVPPGPGEPGFSAPPSSK
jgi:phospholipid/cholesterol/gamma-HCH transport system substrate-binding protein